MERQDWGAVTDRSLGRTFLLTLLLTVDDGKGDNYMVTPRGTIVGIDNDHILSAPYKKLVRAAEVEAVRKNMAAACS